MDNLQNNLLLVIGLIVCWGILQRIEMRRWQPRPVRFRKDRPALPARDRFN
jgi:hypothetical protein